MVVFLAIVVCLLRTVPVLLLQVYYLLYSGATDDGCNDSCTSQDDENSNKNASFNSGNMDDGCNDLITSQDYDNSDDQSFSTQSLNDTDAHSYDDSSDTPCDDDSADDVFVSQCSSNDNQHYNHSSTTTGVDNMGIVLLYVFTLKETGLMEKLLLVSMKTPLEVPIGAVCTRILQEMQNQNSMEGHTFQKVTMTSRLVT
jgi:hypothetical protein